MTDQELAADRLAAALVATALPVLDAAQPPVRLDAVEVEVVEVIGALRKLGRAMPDFCERAILGQLTGVHWGRMADLLGQAMELCREQETRVIDMDTDQ